MPKIIAETNVGSHLWKMQHKDSDIDLFQIYVEPTKNILNGTAKKASYFKQKDNHDYAIHEAEKVVAMLLQGNINFVVGVCSPLINKTTVEFDVLREITMNNLSKNCFHSIN
jgi:predicted nucleotidyltransferase